MPDSDINSYPEKYWHCFVKLISSSNYSVVNDLSFIELHQQIVDPWLKSRQFTISGKIVKLLNSVQTHELSLEDITNEVEATRQTNYQIPLSSINNH
jgi:hypothetical protein